MEMRAGPADDVRFDLDVLFRLETVALLFFVAATPGESWTVYDS